MRDWPGSILKKDRSIATEESFSWEDKSKGMIREKLVLTQPSSDLKKKKEFGLGNAKTGV